MNRPALPAAFRWSRETWGDGLRCEPLGQIAQHVFTTKQLPLRPFDRHRDEWVQAAKAVGGSISELRRVKQVHGRTVRVVRATDALDAAPPDADALISSNPGDVLAIQVADCVPLLLADPRTGAVGAVHAGWRGSAARIAEATVSALVAEFGVRPVDVVAAVGPSIGACCYEVGAELFDAFRDTGASDDRLARWFTRTERGSLRLDLWTVNLDQLIDAGIPPAQIHLSNLCTQTHTAIFDSYRAQGPHAGRMAALIRVPDRHDGHEDH